MLSCEERRKANIADNRRILAEIGLINPFKGLPPLKPKKTVPPPSFRKTAVKRKTEESPLGQEKRPRLEEVNVHQDNNGVMLTRRSARIQRKSKGEVSKDEASNGSVFLSLDDDFDDEQCERKHVPVPKHRPNHFGAVPGIEVGASWLTRVECCRDGVHRPTVAGIHGSNEGAYSIALSGRYDDNVDYGDCFTYTGEGGRDLKGTSSNPKNLREAPQTKDQQLSRGNLALNVSAETGNPVRVIRGYQLKNAFSPEEGYRYDGLYTVKKAWYGVGMSGFKVWRFALQRCPGQAPPPWEMEDENEEEENDGKENVNQENVMVNEKKENVDQGNEEKEKLEIVKGNEKQANEDQEDVKGNEKQSNEDQENVKGNEKQENEDQENVNSNEKQENEDQKNVMGNKKQENMDQGNEEKEKQENVKGNEKQANEDQENVMGNEKQENMDQENKGNEKQENVKRNEKQENEDEENVDQEKVKGNEKQENEVYENQENEIGNERKENMDQENEVKEKQENVGQDVIGNEKQEYVDKENEEGNERKEKLDKESEENDEQENVEPKDI